MSRTTNNRRKKRNRRGCPYCHCEVHEPHISSLVGDDGPYFCSGDCVQKYEDRRGYRPVVIIAGGGIARWYQDGELIGITPCESRPIYCATVT